MVCDIEDKMPPDELIYWVAYFELKDSKTKKAAEEAKRKNPGQVKSKRYK